MRMRSRKRRGKNTGAQYEIRDDPVGGIFIRNYAARCRELRRVLSTKHVYSISHVVCVYLVYGHENEHFNFYYLVVKLMKQADDDPFVRSFFAALYKDFHAEESFLMRLLSLKYRFVC